MGHGPILNCLRKGGPKGHLFNNNVLPRTFLTLVGGPAALLVVEPHGAEAHALLQVV
jgi:hypothetical protein